MIILIVMYFASAILVAAYFLIKTSSDTNQNRFWEFFVTSVLAIFLLPLFLNSLGNSSLKDFFGESETQQYVLLELVSYIVIAAIAGGQLIQKVLKSLDINVDENLNALKEQQKNIQTAHNQLSVGVAKITLANQSINNEVIKKTLTVLKEADKFIDQTKIDTSISDSDLSILENSGLIICSKDINRNKTYRITAAGKNYLSTV